MNVDVVLYESGFVVFIRRNHVMIHAETNANMLPLGVTASQKPHENPANLFANVAAQRKIKSPK